MLYLADEDVSDDEKLTSKDEKFACEYAGVIINESKESDKWYDCFDEVASLLNHKNSFVRNRVLFILSANAQWDDENKFESIPIEPEPVNGLVRHLAEQNVVISVFEFSIALCCEIQVMTCQFIILSQNTQSKLVDHASLGYQLLFEVMPPSGVPKLRFLLLIDTLLPDVRTSILRRRPGTLSAELLLLLLSSQGLPSGCPDLSLAV